MVGSLTHQEHAHIWTSIELKAIGRAGRHAHRSPSVLGVEFSWLGSQWAHSKDSPMVPVRRYERRTPPEWLVVIGSCPLLHGLWSLPGSS